MDIRSWCSHWGRDAGKTDMRWERKQIERRWQLCRENGGKVAPAWHSWIMGPLPSFPCAWEQSQNPPLEPRANFCHRKPGKWSHASSVIIGTVVGLAWSAAWAYASTGWDSWDLSLMTWGEKAGNHSGSQQGSWAELNWKYYLTFTLEPSGKERQHAACWYVCQVSWRPFKILIWKQIWQKNKFFRSISLLCVIKSFWICSRGEFTPAMCINFSNAVLK